MLVRTIFCLAVKYNIFGNVQFCQKIFYIESILEILPMNMYGLALGLEVLECLTPLGKKCYFSFLCLLRFVENQVFWQRILSLGTGWQKEKDLFRLS